MFFVYFLAHIIPSSFFYIVTIWKKSIKDYTSASSEKTHNSENVNVLEKKKNIIEHLPFRMMTGNNFMPDAKNT